MKRLTTLILSTMLVLSAGCTPADEEASEPVIEDGVIAPGEQ